MRMPWAKERSELVHPTIRRIDEKERAAREAEWQAKLKERAERTARIPENLVGYRLSRGCTCGVEARMKAVWGDNQPSMGFIHEDDCEAMRALFVQVIEA